MNEVSNVNKKKPIGQYIFNTLSIIFLLSVGTYFISRALYYSNTDKKTSSDYLNDKLISSIDKYSVKNSLNKINDEYIYIGNTQNNYLKYQGYLWRIIKINNDNTITIVTEDTITSLTPNKIISWLNEENEYVGTFNKSLSKNYLTNTQLCTDKINDINNSTCNNIDNNYTYGILDIKTYLEVGASESYLNNQTTFWTSNKLDDNNSWYINKDGKVSYTTNDTKYGVRVVTRLKADTKYISGNGTYDNPYIIESRNIKELKDTLPSEYISYNNELWKIVSINENSIKLVNTDYIKINNEYLTLEFSNTNNVITPNIKILSYLNKEYLQTLPNKEFLTKASFYTGNYSLTENDYKSTYNNSLNLYVGILSISDLFAYELNETYLLSSSINNDFSIYTVNNHAPYENTIETPNKIRPAINMKPNISIMSGNGTKNDPYLLGGLNNEA